MRCVALAFSSAALAGCGAEPLHVQQSGSADLLTARHGNDILFCVSPPDRFECARGSAQVIVTQGSAGMAAAKWRNDALVEVTAFGGAEIVCRPRALGGAVRVELKRLPRALMPSAEAWSIGTDAMFAGVPDSCG